MLFKNDDDGIPSDVSDYAARPVNGSVVGNAKYEFFFLQSRFHLRFLRKISKGSEQGRFGEANSFGDGQGDGERGR